MKLVIVLYYEMKIKKNNNNKIVAESVGVKVKINLKNSSDVFK